MSQLDDLTKAIQRRVGVDEDGEFGLDTAKAVLAALVVPNVDLTAEDQAVDLDERSAAIFIKLDPKIQPAFRKFHALANAKLAPRGLSYIAVQGTRTMGQQQALYNQGRTEPGEIVTNARPGSSWHNYAVAGDFGVFRGKAYLDEKEPRLADSIHKEIAVAFADACGLAWGGDWTKNKDFPHYQPARLPASPNAAHRSTFKAKGSVL